MTDFDPDKALAEMGEFLTGQRTLEGYAKFADTVRDLHNHISAGGALPRRWSVAQSVTISHYSPFGLAGEHQVGIDQEFKTGVAPEANWMIVRRTSE